jgi:hypothetical protein
MLSYSFNRCLVKLSSSFLSFQNVPSYHGRLTSLYHQIHSTVLTFGNSFVTIILCFLFSIEEEHIQRLDRCPYSKLHLVCIIHIYADLEQTWILVILASSRSRSLYFLIWRNVTNPLICSWRNTFYGSMESQCAIWRSKFATKQCYFCLSKIFTSRIVPEDVTGNFSTTKCITCDRRKINKISIVSVLKRNKFILGILVGFWIYTVFPLPFLQLFGIRVDPTSFQPILITTAVMTIPFLFMFFAWQKRSPKTSQSTISH